ncbi:hypothetical protein EVAR_36_1 [Eumeta japonica]|uniref:Histone acetyltransferase n=1 Tax=Eumeta variegata TaxID=151549 RepID=A0A4C1S7P9_EUMVA|nr:hypothetical protein EVAR_36_1 [Eumeta japonica]
MSYRKERGGGGRVGERYAYALDHSKAIQNRVEVEFGYLLTKVEGKVGSPETPLSDLGLISYRSYWKEALLKRLCSAPGPTLCIRDLSKDLAIASCDIVSTLQERGLMKYWKGKHIVLKKQRAHAVRRAILPALDAAYCATATLTPRPPRAARAPRRSPSSRAPPAQQCGPCAPLAGGDSAHNAPRRAVYVTRH